MSKKFLKESIKYGFIFTEKITKKRRDTNKYISKVENDSDIIINEEKIFEKKGKWLEFFRNKNDIFLEIGTGHGNFFSDEVANNPNKNFIGLELKYKRLFLTAEKCRKKISNFFKTNITPNSAITKNKKEIKHRKKNNFILLKTKGENIFQFLGDKEISRTYVFFPDPWGKKERQKKHRLFSEKFIRELFLKTKKGGKLIFKTDHREYFDTTLKLFEKIGIWEIILKSHDYETDNINYNKSKKTEFETIFDKKRVCYVEFKK